MEIVVRAAVLLLFLWMITRLTGRTTVGELSAFQLVLFVVMGDLIQQAATQQDYSVTAAVLAVGTFALLTIGLSVLNARVGRLRGVTHGIPVVIVTDGIIDHARLRSERLSRDDLTAAARQRGVRQVSDIELAVLETNGKISFFTRSDTHSSAGATPAGHQET